MNKKGDKCYEGIVGQLTDYETKIVGSARFTQKELDLLCCALSDTHNLSLSGGYKESAAEISELWNAIEEQVQQTGNPELATDGGEPIEKAQDYELPIALILRDGTKVLTEPGQVLIEKKRSYSLVDIDTGTDLKRFNKSRVMWVERWALHITESCDGGEPEVVELETNQVFPNPNQPRKEFKKDKLEELKDSIKENGLIQPITVTPRDGRFMIIAGERRFRAVQMANLKTIKAIVFEGDEDIVLELSLIENIQREDMNPVEVAAGYQVLEDRGLSVEEIGEKLGKGAQEVKFYLRLNKLDDQIKQALRCKVINLHIAWQLSRVEDHDEQMVVFRKLRDGELTAAQAGSFVSAYLSERNQETMFAGPTQEQLAEVRRTKLRIGALIKEAAKITKRLTRELADNKTVEIGDVDLEMVGLIGKSMIRLEHDFRQAKRNRALVSELKAVS